jgi:Holliday junction resolvase
MRRNLSAHFDLLHKEPSETVILQQIRKVLQWHGFYVIRIQQGLGCHKGLSDLIAVKAGQVYFIEIKKPKGKLSDHQEKFKAEIEGRKGKYVVLKSYEEAEEFIRQTVDKTLCNVRTLDE